MLAGRVGFGRSLELRCFTGGVVGYTKRGQNIWNNGLDPASFRKAMDGKVRNIYSAKPWRRIWELGTKWGGGDCTEGTCGWL